MATNIAIPTVLVLTLTMGTLTQLNELAQTSSDKAIKYADDMTNAIDCAYTAQPLDQCSPDLFSTSFKEETARTQTILKDLRAQEPGAHLKTEEDLPVQKQKRA